MVEKTIVKSNGEIDDVYNSSQRMKFIGIIFRHIMTHHHHHLGIKFLKIIELLKRWQKFPKDKLSKDLYAIDEKECDYKKNQIFWQSITDGQTVNNVLDQYWRLSCHYCFQTKKISKFWTILTAKSSIMLCIVFF